ncbi:unnamed protein product [Rotaria sp. Silwood2]|nr:unnamed protein product [Rotaria sp. Silwood2]CAF4057054.1 unnamed protein product [Rotaria sp. Silwood2]
MIISIDSYRDININIKHKQVSVAAFVATTTQELVNGTSVCHLRPKWEVIIVKNKKEVDCSRFFAKNTHQLYNPPPGTIIDHTITHQNWFHFYLISQCAKQGTVALTHFYVIWNRTTFKVDHIQRLTFKCHLYYYRPGTIRVPMICQYAHKLAYHTPIYTVEDVDDNVILTGNQGGGTGAGAFTQGGPIGAAGVNLGGLIGAAGVNLGGHKGATGSQQAGLIHIMQSHDIRGLFALIAEELN